MTSIPHDYYLKFVDPKVMDSIQRFHEKTNFTLHESVQGQAYLHNIPDGVLRTLTGNQLELYPDMRLTAQGSCIDTMQEDHPLHRHSSCDYFTDGSIEFSSIKNLLAPLVSKTDSTKRGYPSGGALYPVDVFICNLTSKINRWPCKEHVLHLLPESGEFEVVQGTHDQIRLRKALTPYGTSVGHPNLAIVYAAYIPKTVFKYRYRGYRLAHLEAGSMYMLVDLMSKQVRLTSRPWSGYCDNMVSKCIGLNPTLFYPLCAQLIGVDK